MPAEDSEERATQNRVMLTLNFFDEVQHRLAGSAK
jgi:hypothetical protein